MSSKDCGKDDATLLSKIERQKQMSESTTSLSKGDFQPMN
jgi:hypothetical protein